MLHFCQFDVNEMLLVGNAFSKAALVQRIPGLALPILVSLKKGDDLDNKISIVHY